LFLPSRAVHEPEVRAGLTTSDQYEVQLEFWQQAWNPAARPLSGSPFAGPGSVIYRKAEDGSVTAAFRPPARNGKT
jgi:hypothetical protein